MASPTIQEMLLDSAPGISMLNSTDWALVDTYLGINEYAEAKYLSIQEWYETVHTFLLLICEAEGI